MVENNNHFCIYCGARLVSGQNFCSQCGKEVFHGSSSSTVEKTSKYDAQVNAIEREYDLKQKRASELVKKLFTSDHITYDKFNSAITKSNQIFSNQLDVTKKMIELYSDNNELLEREIENKLIVLKTFITKMEDLINELVINMSSNKKDDDDVNNLFSDMDDLIKSVKDY
jgi:hypothetical protein